VKTSLARFKPRARARNRLPLSFGRQDFLNAHLIDQVFPFQIDQMRTLFIVG
jgi:hypothetical protein